MSVALNIQPRPIIPWPRLRWKTSFTVWGRAVRPRRRRNYSEQSDDASSDVTHAARRSTENTVAHVTSTSKPRTCHYL